MSLCHPAQPKAINCDCADKARRVPAARDGDFGAFTWAPADPMLDRWMELYLAITAQNGHNALIGRELLATARRAGFTDVIVTSSNWTYADPESRAKAARSRSVRFTT